MLRNTSVKSKALHGGLNGTFYSSIRCVHWYHSYKYAQQSKDRYELYNREREFGQDEITDKDRNPHLYWGIWQGRTMIQRVINQWGFSKELKPEKVKRDFEKFTYFGKLDALNFLQNDRSNYPWIDEDGDDALGYNTDEGDKDNRYSHNDYGKVYKDASSEFRDLVLRDNCHGRPVYEWQVPYGLDEAYGYKEVSTSVDVLGNELALSNLNFDWSVSGGSAENLKNSTLLTHNLTGQQILLCDLKDASHAIHQFHPSTVMMPCGAEKLLNSVRSKFSATSRTDLYGTTVGVAWTGLWMMSEYWPSEGFLSIPLGSALITLNAISIFRTFFHQKDSQYKAAFAACREGECNVVLGDWLLDDYDERQHIAQEFDNAATKANQEPRKSYLPEFIHQTDESGTGFTKTMTAMKDKIGQLINTHDAHDQKKVDEISTENWMSSYRDAVNNRRLDLLAHVLNNVEGDKIVMPIDTVDNIPPDLVTSLLVRRMTGNIPITSAPMKFDGGFERVGIEFE